MLRGFLRRRKLADELRRRRLLEIVKGSREKVAVVLFGSRARGGANFSSDFDLLILHREGGREEAERLVEALRSEGIPVDAHIYSLREASEHLPTSSILLDALQEGEVLVDRLGISDLIERARELRRKGIGRVEGGWKLGGD